MNFELLFVLLFLSVPIIAGILLIQWIVKKLGKPKTGENIRKILLITLASSCLGILIYDYWSSHHSFMIELENSCKIEVKMLEIASFMDSPTWVEICVTKKNGSEIELEFEQDGSSLEFLGSEKNQIWIRASYPYNYTIDLENNKVYESVPANEENFVLLAKVTPGFNLVLSQ